MDLWPFTSATLNKIIGGKWLCMMNIKAIILFALAHGTNKSNQLQNHPVVVFERFPSLQFATKISPTISDALAKHWCCFRIKALDWQSHSSHYIRLTTLGCEPLFCKFGWMSPNVAAIPLTSFCSPLVRFRCWHRNTQNWRRKNWHGELDLNLILLIRPVQQRQQASFL